MTPQLVVLVLRASKEVEDHCQVALRDQCWGPVLRAAIRLRAPEKRGSATTAISFRSQNSLSLLCRSRGVLLAGCRPGTGMTGG